MQVRRPEFSTNQRTSHTRGSKHPYGTRGRGDEEYGASSHRFRTSVPNGRHRLRDLNQTPRGVPKVTRRDGKTKQGNLRLGPIEEMLEDEADRRFKDIEIRTVVRRSRRVPQAHRREAGRDARGEPPSLDRNGRDDG